MIFVTAGTTRFPFGRLLKAVDEAMIKSNSGEELVVQKGTGNYDFKYSNVKVFREINFNKMISYLKKARILICHGGPATIFLAIRYGKNMPVIVPRCRKYNEHVSDHQQYFSLDLMKKGLAKVFFPQENLVGKLIEYFTNPKSKIARLSAGELENLIRGLIEYTELK